MGGFQELPSALTPAHAAPAVNVIVAKGEPAPFGPRCESLPSERRYRSVDTLRLRSGVTLRDLIEREGEGT